MVRRATRFGAFPTDEKSKRADERGDSPAPQSTSFAPQPRAREAAAPPTVGAAKLHSNRGDAVAAAVSKDHHRFASALRFLQGARKPSTAAQWACLAEGRFTVGNDPLAVSGPVQEVLDKIPGLTDDEEFKLDFAIREILINAVEHGNLDITYEQKTEAQQKDDQLIDQLTKEGRGDEFPQLSHLKKLYQDRADLADKAGKIVTIDYRIEQIEGGRQVTIIIRDQGRGMEPKAIRDATAIENLTKKHGRGCLATRELVDDVRYRNTGSGTEVTLVKRLGPEATAATAPSPSGRMK